jgi:hypothetical protein
MCSSIIFHITRHSFIKFLFLFIILGHVPALGNERFLKAEDSPNFKLANGIPIITGGVIPKEIFKNKKFFASTQRNGKLEWRFILTFDENGKFDVSMCCSSRNDIVDSGSFKYLPEEASIKGVYYTKSMWTFKIYLNELLATWSKKENEGTFIDTRSICKYADDIKWEKAIAKDKLQHVNYDCELVKGMFDKEFVDSGRLPESFYTVSFKEMRGGSTNWFNKFQKPVYVDYKNFLESKKAREIAAAQERKAAAEKAAREAALAEAERQRVEQERKLAAEKAKQAAEKARLEAEVRALKEAQRDRLGEAFAKRTQAQREAIQQRLFERGLYQSTVDGAFGTGTRAAIEEYARPNNKIDLKTDEGAEAVIAELVALQPSTTGAVIVVAKGRAPLDLSKQANAKLYLDDVREFVALNPKELDPLFLAGSFSPALQEIQNRTFNKAGSSFLKLVAYTRSSAPFREYHEAQSVKRFEAEEGKRTAIAEAIIGHIARLKARIAANPLAADTFQLSQVIQKYQTVPKDADAASLEEMRVSLENDLKTLGVSVAAAAAPASGSGSAAPTKTSAVDLKALSDIDAKDIVVLANLGRDAPHAFRDLKGEIAFEGKIVNACAPGLATLEPQYRAFYEASIDKTLADHKFDIETRCREGLKGLDVLIVSGTDLAKSQDIPPADTLVASLNKKTLGRLVTIKHSDFTRELAKRDILSAQYESDIREGARVGYGALAFKSDTKVGCTVIDEGIEGHDTSIEAALSALQFLSGAVVKETTNVSATVAFRQAQKGQCAVIYASSATLKTILDASKAAGIAPTVLPVWTTASAIAQRAKELSSKQASKMQSEAERLADLKKRQAEAAAKRQAEEAQLEERQRRYRAQHGAKVASLVSSIDGQLKEVRDQIDGALNARKNVDATLGSASFWGVYPKWYADKRMKGWDFDSTVPEPRDYGVAKWRGREVEAVTAQIRVLMKNRKLGEYSDDCWNVGYIIDGEFSMNREPFMAACKDGDALKAWQASNGFETRWDLGVK